jgi:hypothetical protein
MVKSRFTKPGNLLISAVAPFAGYFTYQSNQTS